MYTYRYSTNYFLVVLACLRMKKESDDYMQEQLLIPKKEGRMYV